MAIIDSEIQYFGSEQINDTDLNGGRINNKNLKVSGVLGNVFTSVFRSERIAGSTKFRKLFAKINNDDDDTLFGAQVFFDRTTPADDWVVFFVGTQTDTQADISASATKYGVGNLTSNVVAGDTSVTVTVEDTSLTTGNDAIFRDGSKIRITNKDTPTSEIGTEEELTVSGSPVVSGTQVTLSLDAALQNNYNTGDNLNGTRIMSVYEAGDVKTSVDGTSVTTAGDGDYDFSGNPILGDNIGTIEQTVTLTFTSASNFTAASNVSGVTLPAGTLNTDYSPTNGDVSKPYFTLEAAGFSGTWASGDTLVFTTHPATIPIWNKRVVPANSASLSSNVYTLVTDGESS